jgi:hypothetical protein
MRLTPSLARRQMSWRGGEPCYIGERRCTLAFTERTGDLIRSRTAQLISRGATSRVGAACGDVAALSSSQYLDYRILGLMFVGGGRGCGTFLRQRQHDAAEPGRIMYVRGAAPNGDKPRTAASAANRGYRGSCYGIKTTTTVSDQWAATISST